MKNVIGTRVSQTWMNISLRSATYSSVRQTLTVVIAILTLSALAALPVAAQSVVVVSQDGQQQWHSRITDGNGNPDLVMDR